MPQGLAGQSGTGKENPALSYIVIPNNIVMPGTRLSQDWLGICAQLKSKAPSRT
jgi:hypothetical protein